MPLALGRVYGITVEVGEAAGVGSLYGSWCTFGAVVGGSDGLLVEFSGMDHKPFAVLSPVMII